MECGIDTCIEIIDLPCVFPEEGKLGALVDESVSG